MKEFLWKGNKPKIANIKLIQEYEVGGLKLVDMTSNNKSMKVFWVERLQQPDSFWVHIVNNYYPIECPYIWRCNISPKDIIKFRIENEFWSEVLECWAEINHRSPSNKQESSGNVR